MSFEAPASARRSARRPLGGRCVRGARAADEQYGVRFSNLDVLAAVAGGARSWGRHLPAALLLAAWRRCASRSPGRP